MTLISRLEQAEAGSRELDAEICQIIGWEVRYDKNDPTPYYQPIKEYSWQPVPAYTTSLDAAMTLVPEGWGYCITPRNGVWVRQSEHFPTIHGNAATPALALCVASLKAAGYE